MSLEHISLDTDLEKAIRVHQKSIKNIGAPTLLPTDKEMLEMYKTMLTIRKFEQAAWDLAKTGESLPIHPYTGYEAVSVGVCSLLKKTDKIVVNHRPYGHYIAKGGNLNTAMAELFGKRTGVNKGVGGELYLSEPSIGYVTSDMIVGACITIGTGVALSLKMKKEDAVAVCFFGEAAGVNGAFHEGFSMAALYNVPILYICENNGYSTNTPAVEFTRNELVAQNALVYGFPVNVVDGTDVLAVRDAVQKAIWHIKTKKTPYFIEALVPRLGAHKQQLIEARPKDRIKYAMMRDPIPKYEAALKLTSDKKTTIASAVDKKVEAAVTFARKSTPLTLKELEMI